MCSSKIGAPTPVGKVRPVLTVVPGAADPVDPRRSSGAASLIDELVREGARRMLAEALQAEVEDYIAALPPSATSTAIGWWCATARTSPAMS